MLRHHFSQNMDHSVFIKLAAEKKNSNISNTSRISTTSLKYHKYMNKKVST